MARPAAQWTEASTPWERFYGLFSRPFSLTPDLRFAYQSKSHSQALQQLTGSLRRREGLIVITGEIGTGKTMLCRTMLETFETRTFVSVVLDPGLGVDDLLQQILADFGLVPRPEPGAEPRPPATRHQMVTMLQRFLSTLIPLNAHAVVIVDEAQQLDPAVLEQLRLLSNFETDSAKLLQVVLAGQPNLDELLRRPDMRQLAQRVARRIELHPLAEPEVQRYIERRLFVAREGGALSGPVSGFTPEGGGVRFTPDGYHAVAVITGGVPRVINTLCDRALEIGFDRKHETLDAAVVVAAADQLRLMVPEKIRGTRAPATAAASVDAAREDEPPADFDVPEFDETPEPRVAARFDKRIAAFVVVALGAAAWWVIGRRPAAPPSRAAIERPAIPAQAGVVGGTSASPGASAAERPPAAPAPPAPAPSAAKQPSPADPPAAGPSRYYVAVAAFKTPQRAADIVDQLTRGGLQAAVRPASAGGWLQVVVGPYATALEAAAAQPLLGRQGFSGTRVVAETSAPR
ncbi:MAG TPA: AAA family ATPase [Vicinamibacterales bacterium]|nr:AAA family ATPase [Vicinamibacterales bacterium]